jgi:uncharacterized RDD family membrane protein YckC
MNGHSRTIAGVANRRETVETTGRGRREVETPADYVIMFKAVIIVIIGYLGTFFIAHYKTYLLFYSIS